MKKLLIALTAIASFAGISFGAGVKDDGFISGTSFELLTPGDPLNTTFADDGQTPGANYWNYDQTKDSPATVSNDVITVASRPMEWDGTDVDQDGKSKFLSVDTSDLLQRNIDVVDGAAQDIGNGIYVDTVVQFTASDATTIETDAADKLVVWMQTVDHDADGDIEAYTETNLIVTAGCHEEGKFGPKDYIVNCDGVEPGKWYRLTIKSMKIGEDTAAFVVFINGVAVTTEDVKSAFVGVALDSTAQNWLNKGALFPSLVNAGGNKQTITSLGVEGSGFIDDITFTTTAPDFATDGTLFTLNWDKDAFTALALNGKDLAVADGQVILPFGTTDGDNEFELTYTLAAGFTWLAPTCDAAVTFDSGTFTATGTAVATLNTKQSVYGVGDESFDSLSDALKAAGAGDTIKLLADVADAALVFDGCDVVLDLMGHSITDPVNNETDPTITVNIGSSLKILDSVGGGVISGKCADGTVYSEGTLVIGATTGDAGASFDGLVYCEDCVIYSGKFSDVEQPGFDYADFVDQGSKVSSTVDANGYWVVTCGDVPPPAGLTVTITAEPNELASYELSINDEEAESGATIVADDEVVIIVTPVENYEYKEAPEGWTLETDGTLVYMETVGSESIAITIPTPTEIVEALTVTIVEEADGLADYVLTINSSPAVSGAEVAADDDVVVVATPAENYEYADVPEGWARGEDNTITYAVTVVDASITIAIPTPTEIVVPPPTTFAVTWDDSKANATAVAKVGDAPIASGDKFAKDTVVAFVVTPADNYEYATAPEGWKLEEDGTITATFTVGEAALAVTIPEATAQEAPGGDWDIPGSEGGINGIPGEGDAKYVEFSSIAFTATGATVGLKAGKIDANGQIFGLVCKTALDGEEFVINATLTAEKDAATGLFTITADLSGYTQLFVIGVGPAAKPE